MAGYIYPPIGDVGVPRHSTCDHIGGCTALGFLSHRLALVVFPGTLVECAVLGHYVGEGEGSPLAVVATSVATGAQVATVQTLEIFVVLVDSLTLANLLCSDLVLLFDGVLCIHFLEISWVDQLDKVRRGKGVRTEDACNKTDYPGAEVSDGENSFFVISVYVNV